MFGRNLGKDISNGQEISVGQEIDDRASKPWESRRNTAGTTNNSNRVRRIKDQESMERNVLTLQTCNQPLSLVLNRSTFVN